MARQAEENYRLLKAKVGQIDLGELLRPHFARLLEETIKPIELAKILLKRNIMTTDEFRECELEPLVLFQNLEMYRAVKRKDAGETLIYVLYKTGNFHILQLLESTMDQLEGSNVNSNNLNIPVEPTLNQTTDNNDSLPTKKQSKPSLKSDCALKSKQVSILRSLFSATKAPKPVEPPVVTDELSCMETVGAENLAKLQLDNLDSILVRAVTLSDGCESRKYFSSMNIDLIEEIAITKFIESQLGLDLDTLTVGRPLRELYVNTRSFSSQRWEWFSKLLYYFCRDTLEHLWLDGVNYGMYVEGTKWMKELNDDEQSPLRFANLKTFIFQCINYDAYVAYFHRALELIKPLTCPVEKFWNFSKCQIQIWALVNLGFKKLSALIDPTRKTLLIFGAALQGEIGKFLKQGSTAVGQQKPSKEPIVPIVKLFYDSFTENIFVNSNKLSTLTHLCLRSGTLHAKRL